MSFVTTSALPVGGTEAVALGDTWTAYTATYTGSNPSDTQLNVSLQGSADEGKTWFALTPTQSVPVSGGTGARIYINQPVNAIQVSGYCTSGNTVTVSVTGR